MDHVYTARIHFYVPHDANTREVWFDQTNSLKTFEDIKYNIISSRIIMLLYRIQYSLERCLPKRARTINTILLELRIRRHGPCAVSTPIIVFNYVLGETDCCTNSC